MASDGGFAETRSIPWGRCSKYTAGGGLGDPDDCQSPFGRHTRQRGAFAAEHVGRLGPVRKRSPRTSTACPPPIMLAGTSVLP
jgi:hypothetical protein